MIDLLSPAVAPVAVLTAAGGVAAVTCLAWACGDRPPPAAGPPAGAAPVPPAGELAPPFQPPPLAPSEADELRAALAAANRHLAGHAAALAAARDCNRRLHRRVQLVEGEVQRTLGRHDRAAAHLHFLTDQAEMYRRNAKLQARRLKHLLYHTGLLPECHDHRGEVPLDPAATGGS